ncbi:peroxiredoxin [Bradyrhizobium sp.]|uniref:peroxiredoxin n=1 Tax=Bradyrhizobium sp. TaxID=376 RepID=UPI003C70B28B
MSTKKRKKSPKTATRTTAAKAARGGAKAAANKPAAKAGKAVARKTANKAVKKSGKPANSAPATTSHKAPSKPLKSAPAAGPKSALVEGAKAPAFRLPRDGGDSVSLADFAGSKLVLFFYPRADTPGCTKEAIDFTRLKGAFEQSGAAVLGVSADSVKAQESFRNKHRLSVPLISDEKHEMLQAYGAWGEKSMYGRTFQGILRTTVLIGADGRIARVWRNVRVDGHADEVLAAARGL